MGSVGAVDGSKGWARNLWNMLNEGGVWMVPRSWMALTKRDGKLICNAMPWDESLGISEEEFMLAQLHDFDGIRDMFAGIGVEVVGEIAANSEGGA